VAPLLAALPPGPAIVVTARSLPAETRDRCRNAARALGQVPVRTRGSELVQVGVTDALRGLAAALAGAGTGKKGGAPRWKVTGLSRLTDACGPISVAHQCPSPPEAAALRAVALALADGASPGGPDANGVLQTVAATVTLIQNRSKGAVAAGEAVVLALG